MNGKQIEDKESTKASGAEENNQEGKKAPSRPMSDKLKKKLEKLKKKDPNIYPVF